MLDEQYIEHEVQLRLHSERFKFIDEKSEISFKAIDNRMNSFELRLDHMDNKLNVIIGLFLGSFLLPIILHHYHLI